MITVSLVSSSQGLKMHDTFRGSVPKALSWMNKFPDSARLSVSLFCLNLWTWQTYGRTDGHCAILWRPQYAFCVLGRPKMWPANTHPSIHPSIHLSGFRITLTRAYIHTHVRPATNTCRQATWRKLVWRALIVYSHVVRDPSDPAQPPAPCAFRRQRCSHIVFDRRQSSFVSRHALSAEEDRARHSWWSPGGLIHLKQQQQHQQHRHAA